MAWLEESGLEAHRQTPHNLEFRDRVADWIAEPRRNEPFVDLFKVDR